MTPTHGFRANLTASLADLVQLECLARSTHVIRVKSNDDVGYLYFQNGQIVHAMSPNGVGESAALEILGWEDGSFEPCSAGWLSTATITMSWQSLLMRAATARDEAQRDRAKGRTVLNFPRERSQAVTPMPEKPPLPLSTYPRPQALTTSQSPPSSQSTGAPSGGGIERAVRLEADGKVLSTRGETGELAAVTAYATRLGALIGDALGMEGLRAVECIAGSTRRLFYVEKNGNLIGLEARTDVDLGPLRDKLGL